MSIDFTKPVQCRDGRSVRILCTDANSVAGTVVALIKDVHGNEHVEHWYSDGCFMADKTVDDRDLINVPPHKKKVKVFIELRRDRDGSLYAAARPHETPGAAANTIASATIEMEYEEQP
jgi:hypothetical protein